MAEQPAAARSDLEVGVHEGRDHPAWDQFLEKAPGGHHVQTAMWSQVKATVGWEALRVTASTAGQIVAGAQVLYRRLGRIGHIGYVAHGPVAPAERPDAAEAVLDALEEVVAAHRIHHLTIQPPLPVPGLAPTRRRPHHLAGHARVAASATSLIDLEHDEDTLLGRMQRGTRYNVRLSGRRGVTVRSGTAADVALYHRLAEATARRRNFTAFPLRYYEEMWQVLHPGGHIRIAIAEHEGEPVAAQLCIGFGRTAVNKLSVWSGRAGSARPNEAIQWSTIRWAKAQGFDIYDLEGIDLDAARKLTAGEELPRAFAQTTTSFKVGFGGRTVLAPEALDFVPNPVARWAFAELYPRLANRRVLKRARKRLRTPMERKASRA